ncbi:MAG TPA: excinuclease ABC subunit UvrC, partial [Candidatus Eisenbacteria bacterium]|nr:excinuclease ABC subunit UvrC [Candidatus Eisenbacteria bacterium]
CTDIEAHIQAKRECLEFHIGRCTGPCIAAQSAEDYRAMVDQFCDFLSGKREEVVARLRALQENAAERREYERAARLRDQIKKLEQILARQRMVDVAGLSADVLGLAREGERCCVVVLKVRERRVVAKDVRWLRGTKGKTEGELLRAFVTLYYSQTESIPETLVVETDPAECELLVSYLERGAGSPVRVRQPRDGTERALLRTAHRNATMLVSRAREAAGKGLEGNAADEAVELQRALGIDRLPRRIRCFDVSQLFGTYVVASMVTFVDGRPFKNEYRHYRIRTVEGQDDFASIAEAVRRHAWRVTQGDMEAADLVLIDGGIGQLQAALAAVQGTPLEAVPFAGLAKRLEEIVRPGGAPVLRLSRRSPALKLLMRVRDEAHRFAIIYHRTLRGRAVRSTELEKVPGLGPKRQALLLRRFGSVERLKQQPVDAIAAVPGIGERMAARILEVVGSAGGPQ